MDFASLKVDSVKLRVSDLARSVDFYGRQMGFVLVTPGVDGRAVLAAQKEGPPLLELREDPTAAPSPRTSAGLFHAALLLPSRGALGAWLRHAAAEKVEFEGFSDHGVSEAIYLSDPDGNGLEFYADRPRKMWPLNNGELDMITAPLNVRDLIGSALELSPAPLSGSRWGHLHLRVRDLDASEKFYTSTLHLALTQRYGSSARFLAADGYHHHLGLNTWGGVSLPQASGALGLVAATLSSAAVSAEVTVSDPDGITFHLRPL